MNASETIDAVYAGVKSRLPSALASTLKFHPAEDSFKFGVHNTGGRILGKQAGKIWAGRWCFYSVVVGPDQHNMSRVGGVGFGCAVNQKPCGAGRHEAALLEIAGRFCASYPQFHHSTRGKLWLSIATPYCPSTGRDFPVEQAAQDLIALIEGTFPAIDALAV